MSFLTAGAGISTDLDAVRATAEAAADASRNLIEPPDLVVAFVAQDHRDAAEDVAQCLHERFPDAAVIGGVFQGVISGAHEHETGPAVSVWCARLPETLVQPFRLVFDEEGEGLDAYKGWPDLPHGSALLLLVDPFSIPSEHLLTKINDERPGTQVVGGVASGVHAANEARLFVGDQVHTSGAIGVAISGRVRIDTLVSQGCRPIGKPAVITRADRQMIFELGGERPIDLIREMWNKGSPRDRGLLANGPLFLGIVADEYNEDEFAPGDFVIRNVVGANPERGWIAVGDVVETGQTVQFHVRDPESADEDLRDMLSRVQRAPVGALMFTCNGRGSNMFDEPNHDALAVYKGLHEVPLAGSFANGELGPIGPRNFMHGHTASLALFVDPHA